VNRAGFEKWGNQVKSLGMHWERRGWVSSVSSVTREGGGGVASGSR
jgi:hypothetical protein